MSGSRRFFSRLTVLSVIVLMSAAAGAHITATPSRAAQDGVAANKQVIARLYAAINAHDLDAFGALLAPDVVDHNGAPDLPTGREGVALEVAGFLAAFPDLHVTVMDVIGEGDRVFVRDVFTGTNNGAFLGFPATGRSVAVEGYNIYRIAGGMVVEYWHVDDILGLVLQLGIVPVPPDALSSPDTAPSTSPAGPAITHIEGADLVNRFVTAFNERRWDAMDALFAPDLLEHGALPGQPRGAEGVKTVLRFFTLIIPDATATPEDIIVEGDRIVLRKLIRGTNSQFFPGIPGTGAAVAFETVDVYRVAGGRIAEAWTGQDLFTLLVQMGLIDLPE